MGGNRVGAGWERGGSGVGVGWEWGGAGGKRDWKIIAVRVKISKTKKIPPRAVTPEHVKESPKPKNLLVPSLLRRHACLTTPERVKQSPNPPTNPSCCRS